MAKINDYDDDPFTPAGLAYSTLRTREIAGVIVEDNKFCCSVHFRQCNSQETVEKVEKIVKEIVEAKGLQMKQGRKVFEVRPQVRGCGATHSLSHSLTLSVYPSIFL